MAHPLAKQWKSKVRGSDDIHGDFDLRQMTNGGDVSQCTHGPNHDHITGITDEIPSTTEAPTAKFFVRINQTPPNLPGVEIKYRGIAVSDANNEIHKIFGFKRVIVTSLAPKDAGKWSREDEAALALIVQALAQDEGTWVATQP